MTAPKTTKAAKKPADHKPKKAEQDDAPAFDTIEGHDLLLPFSQVDGAMQARLLGRMQRLGLDLDGGPEGDDSGDKKESLDLDGVADLIDFIAERLAKDEAKFRAFTSGHGGFERAINLAIAYAGELGKSGN